MAVPDGTLGGYTGGYYGGTDWSGHDVAGMWKLLESQETEPHWKLVAGWRKTYELTSMHLSRLTLYRSELAEAWPPRPGSASAAYVARLDALITHVQSTYDAAVANYTAFSGATGAIGGARQELKKLYDEYQANQVKLAAYADEQAAAKARAAAGTPTPSPRPSPTPSTPPVPAGRQEALNAQARSLMFQLSNELVQARAAIRQVPRFQPIGGGVEDEPTSIGGSALGVPPPPMIPPIVTTPTHSVSAPVQPPVQTPIHSAPGSVIGGGGPALGGATPGVLNPTLPSPPTVPTPPPSTGIIGPPLPPTVTPVVKPTGGLIGGSNPTTPSTLRGTTRPTGMPRAMPPGGVIGPVARPGAGQPGGMRPVPPRVNPVGGVIGGTPPGARPGTPGTTPVGGTSGRGGAGTGRPGQHYGTTSGVRGGQRTEEDGPDRHWDPDNPWRTDEGTDPVVLPPTAVRVDPGPAIGFDR